MDAATFDRLSLSSPGMDRIGKDKNRMPIQ